MLFRWQRESKLRGRRSNCQSSEQPCWTSEMPLHMSSDRTVEPDIRGGEDFVHKTVKNVGVNIVSQSKDNHELDNYFHHDVKLLVTL